MHCDNRVLKCVLYYVGAIWWPRQVPLRTLFDFPLFSLFFMSPAPITNVEAIEGQQAHLYCPMTTPTADKINMVLWFKDDVGVPIYRYVNTEEKYQRTNVEYFPSPAALMFVEKH